MLIFCIRPLRLLLLGDCCARRCCIIIHAIWTGLLRARDPLELFVRLLLAQRHARRHLVMPVLVARVLEPRAPLLRKQTQRRSRHGGDDEKRHDQRDARRGAARLRAITGPR